MARYGASSTASSALASGVAARAVGAVLCVAVAVIHVLDQGGFPGSKEPAYVGILYYILEAAGVLTALLLIAGWERVGWTLALGVAAGPFAGYTLSRGTGLPDYSDDMGNWAEPLGVLSLIVEAGLFVLAIVMLRRGLRSGR
ncbi:hypothetical protein ACWDKQ_28050 [Saccharopolyspora sp. NPDC000995]